MIDISLICIYNNQEMFDQLNLQLKDQVGIDYELLSYDNVNNNSNNPRKIINEYATKAEGKYLVVLHQDIRFTNNDCLRLLYDYLLQIDEFGVVGVAGCPEYLEDGKRIIFSDIIHGSEKKQAGRHVDSLTPIQTVDECLFAVEKEYFLKNKYEEIPGWHLYGVELCLMYSKVGRKNYVAPIELWHLSSGGSYDYKYLLQLRRIIKNYGDDNKVINTTVKKWEISIKGQIEMFYIFSKKYIKHILQKLRIIR